MSDIHKPVKTDIILISKELISDNVYEFKFKSEDKINFSPGQYINVQFEEGLRRSYSIVSVDDKVSTHIIDLSPNGPASKYLKTIEVGTKLHAIIPLGRFVLEFNERPKVFIATGTGVAPFIPMIRTLIQGNFNNEILILFGVRYDKANYANLYLRDEVNQSNINFQPCITQTEDNNTFKGRVTDFLKQKKMKFVDYDYYVCGNPNMVTDVIKILESKGVTTIFSEKY